MRGAPAGACVLGAAQLGLGVALVSSPRRVVALIGADHDAATRIGARVLGARLIGQGAVVATTRRVGVHQLSALVDAVHAVSMVALAACSSQRRRAAAASGALATVAALASAVIAARAEHAP